MDKAISVYETNKGYFNAWYINKVSTVRQILTWFGSWLFSLIMFKHQFICESDCILYECAFSDQVLYIYVCSCVCWHHHTINISLWHMWLHNPCSHVSTVQLSSIRTLWQLLSSLSSLPTRSALKTKITTPLLAVPYETSLPLVAWGYEMQALTGITNTVWDLTLCIPLLKDFLKRQYCSTDFCLNYSAGHKY